MKRVALKSGELPAHSHRMKDYYYSESDKKTADCGQRDRVAGINYGIGSSGTDYDNDYLVYHLHDTEAAGGGGAHENRPPYYVLAYVMRVR